MPYTRNQWLQLPAGKRGFATYGRYLDWWNERVKPKLIKDRKTPVAGRPGVSNPTIPSYLNPISQEDLLAQANAQVTASTRPVLDQIAKQFAEQTTRIGGQYQTQQTQGVADIGRAQQIWQSAVQNQVGQVGAAYDTEIQGQKDINAGIQGFLQGAGQQLMGNLTEEAKAAGAPAATLQAIAGRGEQGGVPGLGGLTAGAQNMALGESGAGLSRLFAERTADVNYANTLPGMTAHVAADDTGRYVRDIGTRQAASLSEIAANQQAAVGDVTAGIPGLVQDVYSNLLQNETTKAGLLGNFKQDAAQRALERWKVNRDVALQKFLNKHPGPGATGGSGGYQFKVLPNGQVSVFDSATGTWSKPQGNYGKPVVPGTGPASKKLANVQGEASKRADALYAFKNPTKATKVPVLDAAGNPTYGPSGQIFKTTAATPGQRTPNTKAIRQIRGYWREQFPGMPDEWVNQQAGQTLVNAGYDKAAVVLQSQKSFDEWKRAISVPKAQLDASMDAWWNKWYPKASKKAQKQAGGSLAAAKGRDETRTTASAKPTKPAKTAPATSPSERGSAQQSKTAAAATKRQKEIEDKAKKAKEAEVAQQGIRVNAANDLDSRLKNMPTNVALAALDNPKQIANWTSYLVNRYKLLPKTARNIVNSAVARYREGHGK